MLMPTLTYVIVYLFLPEIIKPLGLITLPFLFVTTFLIPLLSISVLKYTSNISSLTLENREERLIPFIFVAVFYAITSYMFVYKVRVNPVVGVMLVSTTVLIILLTIITLFEKISIHSAGMSGVVGFLIVFALKYPDSTVLYPLLVMIVLAGLVMTSRLYLNAHTPREIFSGFLVGFTVCFGMLYLLD